MKNKAKKPRSAIPLMDTEEMARTVERADEIRMLAKSQHWTFEETLRALSAVVFWSGGPKRKRVIAWMEELLRDLKNTPTGGPDVAVDIWEDMH